MQAKDKNIIVTGGGNGVGRELVIKLLSRGANVAAVDIDESALQEIFRLSGKNRKLVIRVLDITDKEAVYKFAEEIISFMDHIDGIINNAGIIQPFEDLKDLNMDQIDKVMNVNFYGTLYLIKALLNHLITRPEAHIVNIASMGGFLPVPGQGLYGASKAAVKLMTEALSSELKDSTVNVSVVFPGGIATDIKKNSQITDENASVDEKNSKIILSPAAAADKIINGMEKNKTRFCIGKDAKLMNFLYRISPGLAGSLITSVMSSNH